MNENLIDPTAEYCKQYSNVIMKFVKNLTKFWYVEYRNFGISAIDAIRLARQEVQKDIDKWDFTINFDGPMIL